MTRINPPKLGRIATRQGRPAYFTPMIRERQRVTNAGWQAQRRKASKRGLFARLIGKVLR